MVQLESSCLLFYGFSNSYNPTSYIIQNMTSKSTDDMFTSANFYIVGSKMNIEKIVCRYISPFVYCGIIHTSHLLSWVKAGMKTVDGQATISNYTSRVFQNHPLWNPVNLEVDDKFIAVEAQSTSQDQIPKILLYNVTTSQYVWYSISLMDSATTNADFLSFVLVNISGIPNVIVANRKPSSNYLMYYETRPMILSINEDITPEEVNEIHIQIGGGSSVEAIYPLSSIFKWVTTDTSSPPQWKLVGYFFALILVIFFLVFCLLNYKKEDNQISTADIKKYHKTK